jgi:hypothetical protein
MKTPTIAGTLVKTHITACRGKHGHGMIDDHVEPYDCLFVSLDEDVCFYIVYELQ